MDRIVTTALMLFTSATLQAGISVDIESRGSGVGTDDGRFSGQMLIDQNRLRMDLDPARSLIFLAAGPSVILINHTDHWFTELDKESADAIASSIDPVVSQLREQLANLPKEQREWLTEMLGGTLDLSEKPAGETMRLVETGQLGKAPNGQECRWLRVFKQDKLVQENCVGPSSGMVGGKELEAILRTAAIFYKDVVGSLDSSGILPIPDSPVPEMVPPGALSLISRFYLDGEILTDTRIMGSRELEIEEQAFQAPEDYARREPGPGLAIPN
ncbi:MAG: hypothetical protein OQK99_08825 [Gammaproteobacteria bacterium]|jgi:hypothetical protein|nr:hypothetical protein [Gammaproteobacteria bacterium]